jgi:hypothetical protein
MERCDLRALSLTQLLKLSDQIAWQAVERREASRRARLREWERALRE